MSERITPAREHQPAAVHEHQAPAPERTHSNSASMLSRFLVIYAAN